MLTLSRDVQRAIDERAASELGLPVSVLMEHAGQRLLDAIETQITATGIRAVISYAGAGNNGGDAWVLARLLEAEGIPNAVLSTDTSYQYNEAHAAHRARRAAERSGVPTLTLDTLEDWLLTQGIGSDKHELLLVDGLLGSGFDPERPLSPVLTQHLQSIDDLRQDGATVLAVDLPSGIDADSGQATDLAVRADITVSFLAPKQGCVTWPGRGHCGELRTAGLGLPADWWQAVAAEARTQHAQTPVRWITADSLQARVPTRAADAHKGTQGHVLILAGSPATPGAAILAVEASLRSGVGLTYTLVDPEIAAALLTRAPEAVIDTFGNSTAQTHAQLDTYLAKADAVVLGPGSGNTPRTKQLLERVFPRAKRLLLDADAVNVLAEDPAFFHGQMTARRHLSLEPPVLTPHPGEFQRLFPNLDVTQRLHAAHSAAEQSGCHIILKGAGTILASPNPEHPIRVNSSGNAALARGGSGDLLAGLAGSLLAQLDSLEDALDIAVFLHGHCADLALQDGGTQTAFGFSDWFAKLPAGTAQLGFR